MRWCPAISAQKFPECRPPEFEGHREIGVPCLLAQGIQHIFSGRRWCQPWAEDASAKDRLKGVTRHQPCLLCQAVFAHTRNNCLSKRSNNFQLFERRNRCLATANVETAGNVIQQLLIRFVGHMLEDKGAWVSIQLQHLSHKTWITGHLGMVQSSKAVSISQRQQIWKVGDQCAHLTEIGALTIDAKLLQFCSVFFKLWPPDTS
mmetsp:Transcript_118838/g.296358  ORF Transcript_118838/g.296358 Transcript_118838/m.296358 type:complete len:204 (+) Transcript_118838:950-1561(+)